MKYKIGDYVRIVDEDVIGRITSISSLHQDYSIECDNKVWYTSDADLELVTPTEFEPAISKKRINEVSSDLMERIAHGEFIPDPVQEKFWAEHFKTYYSDIHKVIYNDSTTIVLLKDGRKGVVQLSKDDEHSYETGALYAYIKALKQFPILNRIMPSGEDHCVTIQSVNGTWRYV